MEVQMVSDVRLPSLVRRQLVDNASNFFERHSWCHPSMIHLHLKQEGKQLVMHIKCLTDQGRYLGSSIGYDARALLDEALDHIAFQAIKHRERRMAVA